jgi:hypothetical protein
MEQLVEEAAESLTVTTLLEDLELDLVLALVEMVEHSQTMEIAELDMAQVVVEAEELEIQFLEDLDHKA